MEIKKYYLLLANIFNVVIEKTRDIEVVTVDSFNCEKVSFIKFDVEGSELSAIEGAKKTIIKKILKENFLQYILIQNMKY